MSARTTKYLSLVRAAQQQYHRQQLSRAASSRVAVTSTGNGVSNSTSTHLFENRPMAIIQSKNIPTVRLLSEAAAVETDVKPSRRRVETKDPIVLVSVSLCFISNPWNLVRSKNKKKQFIFSGISKIENSLTYIFLIFDSSFFAFFFCLFSFFTTDGTCSRTYQGIIGRRKCRRGTWH